MCLFQPALIFCYAPHLLLCPSSLYSLLTVFLCILISLCSSLLTCSLFSCSCRLWSLLHTSSILSWDSTMGALMLLSSSPFVPASFSQELSFSSSTPLNVVWLSSVDRKTQFRCVTSQWCKFLSVKLMFTTGHNVTPNIVECLCNGLLLWWNSSHSAIIKIITLLHVEVHNPCLITRWEHLQA